MFVFVHVYAFGGAAALLPAARAGIAAQRPTAPQAPALLTHLLPSGPSVPVAAMTSCSSSSCTSAGFTAWTTSAATSLGEQAAGERHNVLPAAEMAIPSDAP